MTHFDSESLKRQAIALGAGHALNAVSPKAARVTAHVAGFVVGVPIAAVGGIVILLTALTWMPTLLNSITFMQGWGLCSVFALFIWFRLWDFILNC